MSNALNLIIVLIIGGVIFVPVWKFDWKELPMESYWSLITALVGAVIGVGLTTLAT